MLTSPPAWTCVTSSVHEKSSVSQTALKVSNLENENKDAVMILINILLQKTCQNYYFCSF